jgi:hypothetical protein
MTAAAMFFSISASSFASDFESITVDELRVMRQGDLDATYQSAEAGPLPDGDSKGTAVFFPGSIINTPTQLLAALFWQGKVFDTDDGILVNKVVGFKAIKAEVFYGESLFDGGESIIIDYSRTSIVANRIRDEIRMVAPGIYLGRAYMRTLLADIMVVNFVLDFTRQ